MENKKLKNKKKYTLADLQEAYKKKQVFEAYIKDVDDKYTLHCVFADGKEGVIPREEVSCVVEEDGLVSKELCEKKKDKIMQVCIKDIKEVDGKIELIVLSRKELELKVRKWMYINLKPGMKLKGVVRGMTDYAAFVDVGGGVTGFLKLEEVSFAKIQKISDKLHLGQRLECLVKKYDKDTGKIELSIKDSLEPFEKLVKRFKEGDIVEGTVRNKIKNGMLIELSNNLIALADHVSGIEYSQKVLVYIKKINMEKQKIKVEIIG